MARFAKLFTEHAFATGVAYYQDHYPEDREQTPRIVIEAQVGQDIASFIVDTGAPWCVLDPKTAYPLISGTEPDRIVSLNIRGYWYDGGIFTINICLIAVEEQNLCVEAAVFVPTLQPDEEWLHPNFIGLQGLLNRIRFAVDPEENAFYFGTDSG